MGWDRNLDFDETAKLLKNEIVDLVDDKEHLERKGKSVIKKIKLHIAYDSILYIQLHNGSRISETIEGIIKFIDNGKPEQRVKTRKRIKKKKTDAEKALQLMESFESALGEELVDKIKKVMRENSKNDDKQKTTTQGKAADRLIIIKKDIKKEYFDIIRDRTPKQIQNGVCIFALNHHKINTHSLRYAFINHAGKGKTPANIITSAIRHSSLETISNYTREQAGDDLIREMNK